MKKIIALISVLNVLGVVSSLGLFWLSMMLVGMSDSQSVRDFPFGPVVGLVLIFLGVILVSNIGLAFHKNWARIIWLSIVSTLNSKNK